MSPIDVAAHALAWLGRQGTRAVAASIFIGIAVPPLAALLKPVFVKTVFVLLCLAFLRVDPVELRAHFRRPWLIAAAAIWTMLATPILLGGSLMAFGINVSAETLFIVLILQAAAPPLISAPTLAALMGLDAALSLATLIVCMAATPLTAPVFAAFFLGPATAIAPCALGLKLLAMLGGAVVVATLVRRIARKRWVERQRESFDGLSVIALFIFAVALMDGVLAATLNDPLAVIGLTVLAFALALGLTALTTLVFAGVGFSRALALGLASGNRNMGLMLAAVGSSVPDLIWLYFAVAQFPIYLLPQMLKPVVRRSPVNAERSTVSGPA